MLMPKRTKHRKMFRGRMKWVQLTEETQLNLVIMDYKLWTILDNKQTNRILSGCYQQNIQKRRENLYKNIPDKPITARPAGVRMGKGKGNVEGWVCVVKPGRIMFEVVGVTEEKAVAALRKLLWNFQSNAKLSKKKKKKW